MERIKREAISMSKKTYFHIKIPLRKYELIWKFYINTHINGKLHHHYHQHQCIIHLITQTLMFIMYFVWPAKIKIPYCSTSIIVEIVR